VALAAHGHAFDQVLSPGNVSRGTGLIACTLRAIALRESPGNSIREQAKRYGSRERNENHQRAG
jgi:hypothetical protein